MVIVLVSTALEFAVGKWLSIVFLSVVFLFMLAGFLTAKSGGGDTSDHE